MDNRPETARRSLRSLWSAIAACTALAACTVPETNKALPDSPLRAATPIAWIPSQSAKKRCAITRLVDGDTIVIACPGGSGNARLIGFDAPETHQSQCLAEKRHGQAATAYLGRVLGAASVIVPKTRGKDKYGRALVALTVDDVPLARIMIAAGYAVPNHGERRINWCTRLARSG